MVNLCTDRLWDGANTLLLTGINELIRQPRPKPVPRPSQPSYNTKMTAIRAIRTARETNQCTDKPGFGQDFNFLST
jgi:hypothetical protein